MQSSSIFTIALACQLTVATCWAETEEEASSNELKLKQVVLYSAGLGAFLYEAEVKDAVVFAIEIPESEVSDVLRSLFVNDPANQLEFVRVAAAADPSLPGVALPSLESRIDLLLSLRGELLDVEMNSGARHNGRLVAVENSLEPLAGLMSERIRLSLLTDESLATILLDDIRSFQPCDASVKHQVTQALDQRFTRQSTVTTKVKVGFRSAQKRIIELGLMRPIPAWKTSYTLRDNQLAMRVFVDNTTSCDWNDVTLTVADGQPVAFRVDLHQVVRLKREPLQLPLGLPGLPPIFGESSHGIEPNLSLVASASQASRASSGLGGMGGMGGSFGGFGGFGGSFGGSGGFGGVMGGTGSGSPNNSGNGLSADTTGKDSFGGGNPFGLPSNFALAAQAALTAANDGTGDNFAMTFKAVSLPAQTTSLLTSPAIDVDAEPVSTYVESYNPTTPLFSQRMLNRSDMLLPAGPITFFAGSRYQGEAMLPRLSPGRSRLVSYALDSSLRIAPSSDGTNRSIRSIVFDEPKRQLVITDVTIRKDRFVVTNLSGNERQLEISYPEPGADWSVKLEASDEKIEHTYRLRLVVPQKVATTRTVELESSQKRILTYQETSLQDLEALQSTELTAIDSQRLSNLIASRKQYDNLLSQTAAIEMKLRERQTDIDRLVKILSTDGLLATTKERYAARIEERELERSSLAQQLRAIQVELSTIHQQLVP